MINFKAERKRWIGLRAVSLLLTFTMVFQMGQAFQLSMKSATPRPSQQFRNPTKLRPPLPFLGSKDLSSSLISQLAVLAVKLRLDGHTDVSCDVTSSPSDLLLHGRVGPVTVKGKGWRSGLGLTCRAMEASVGTCELDVAKIISKRKLRLTQPAKGKAMVALDSVGFGNFLAHTFVKPSPMGDSESPIVFEKDGTNVDPKTGTVTFFAKHDDARWKCLLSRGEANGQRAMIKVLPVEGTIVENVEAVCDQMSRHLSSFFNKMVFELDGTFLSFRDMMVTDKGESPSVMLALNILVKKFPSPGVAF